MEAAALSLKVDSSSVVAAANDLDRFSAASERAGKAAGVPAGSIARLAASAQSMDAKLSMVVSGLDKVNASLLNLAKAGQGAAAANDNVSRSLLAADSHVIAYTQHLAKLGAAQQDANAHVLAYQNSLRSQPAIQAQANAHVEAYRKHIASLAPAMDKASASAGSLQANTGNIAAQFQDIGVTAAMGMNPLIIGLQQGTQLSAVFAQSGGSMRDVLVGAFKQIASAQALATIGLVALIAVAIQLAMAWFNSGNEADKLAKRIEAIKTASDGVSGAQSALGGVFDLTTGKMKTQTAAAINLARAQLLLQKATAQVNIAKAAKDLDQSGNLGFFGRLGAYVKGDRSLIEGSARVELLTKALKSNQITTADAMKGFQILADRGDITNEMFLKGSAAAANYGMEIENVRTATQALTDLERGKLSDIFMNPNKPRKIPKGPKTDAEKLSDVYASASADIAAEKTRALAAANDLGAQEAARMEKATALLNAIQQKGIPITDAVRKKVGELADEYARLKIAADVSGVINSANEDIQKQRDAVADQVKLIGLYGDGLARATREQEAQKRLRDALPKGEIVVAPNLTRGLSDDIDAANRSARMEKLRKDAEDSAYAMDLERKGLNLTGGRAMAYAFVVDRLNEAKRAGITLSGDEIAAINAAGDAYAAQRHAIDQQAQAIADSREITRGFFSDWINGVREGGNLFKTFADTVINSLSRITEKLLDRTLTGFFDNMGSGGPGGFLSSILGGSRSAGSGIQINPNARPVFGGGSQGNPSGVLSAFAHGGAFDQARRFAKGGAFTNSVVTSPTLFRFANGGALGEMGEAGPEAIMPLKRGPNGALGVHVNGGGRAPIRMGDVHNEFKFEGAVGLDGIASMVRQGGEATYNQVKRDLQTLLQQLDTDGAFAS